MVSTAWGAIIWIVCPKVNFSASLVRMAVAAVARKQLGHPAATQSSLLERYATGLFQGPRVWVRTPFFYASSLSHNELERLV